MKSITYLIAFFLIATSPTLMAQVADGSIKIFVTDKGNGEPIAFANVGVFHDKLFITGGVTDHNGLLVIGNITPGVYDLEVSYTGYSKMTIKQVTVRQAEMQVQNFQLAQGMELQAIVVVAEKNPLLMDSYGGQCVSTNCYQSSDQNSYSRQKNTNSKPVNPIVRGSRSSNYITIIDGQPVNQSAHRSATFLKVKEQPFFLAKNDPLSTFSIDVDNASYTHMRAEILQGIKPKPESIRIEEMINYFKYDYPIPKKDEPFSVNSELAKCPWNESNLLLRVAIKGYEMPIEELPANNLVFLLDVSGSMGSDNKIGLLKKSMIYLTERMRNEDMVTIVVYAGAAGLVLEPTSGRYKEKIRSAIENLGAGGSTAGGAGIQLAYEMAVKNFIEDGNNRVILATDGDFNVGVTSNSTLEQMIEEKRKTGVYLTTIGFGTDNLADDRLEMLADKGNGNYFFIDNYAEATRVFGTEIAGTLLTIAKDVKIQLEFNPLMVKSYRLIGYENRALENQDFNDDKKDAGELGAGHCVTAFYEIIPTKNSGADHESIDPLRYQNTSVDTTAPSNEWLTVKLRYKLPNEFKSKRIVQYVVAEPTNFEMASNDFKWASAVAAFGMWLSDSKYLNDFGLNEIIQICKTTDLKRKYADRVECVELMTKLRHL